MLLFPHQIMKEKRVILAQKLINYFLGKSRITSSQLRIGLVVLQFYKPFYSIYHNLPDLFQVPVVVVALKTPFKYDFTSTTPENVFIVIDLTKYAIFMPIGDSHYTGYEYVSYYSHLALWIVYMCIVPSQNERSSMVHPPIIAMAEIQRCIWWLHGVGCLHQKEEVPRVWIHRRSWGLPRLHFLVLCEFVWCSLLVFLCFFCTTSTYFYLTNIMLILNWFHICRYFQGDRLLHCPLPLWGMLEMPSDRRKSIR